MAGCFAQPLSDDMHFGSRPEQPGDGRQGFFSQPPSNTSIRQLTAGTATGWNHKERGDGGVRPFASPFAADPFLSRSPYTPPPHSAFAVEKACASCTPA